MAKHHLAAIILSCSLVLTLGLSVFLKTNPGAMDFNLNFGFGKDDRIPTYKIGTFYAMDADGTQDIMAISDFLRDQPGVVYVKVETGNLFVIKVDPEVFEWKQAWRTIRYNNWARLSHTDFVLHDHYR